MVKLPSESSCHLPYKYTLSLKIPSQVFTGSQSILNTNPRNIQLGSRNDVIFLYTDGPFTIFMSTLFNHVVPLRSEDLFPKGDRTIYSIYVCNLWIKSTVNLKSASEAFTDSSETSQERSMQSFQICLWISSFNPSEVITDELDWNPSCCSCQHCRERGSTSL
jgi:hypothetical protein